MLRQISVFALALVSAAATAGPLADTVNGVLGAGGPAPSSLIAPIAAPLTSAVSTLEASAAPVTSAAPLPVLEPTKEGLIPVPNGTLPVGVTVLNDGPSNTGYDTVVGLAGTNVVGYGDGTGDAPGAIDVYQDVLSQISPDPLGTPDLINQNPPSGSGAVSAGVFNGDNTANAATGTGGSNSGLGIALFSGDNTGNGTVGIGVGNGSVTGNGSAVGVAALSDNRDGTSGNGGQLGVSVLNQGDPLSINGNGVQTVRDQTGNTLVAPSNPLVSGAVLAGDNTGNTNSALISGAVLSGDNSGNGGVVAVSVLSGNNTGQGGLVGAAVVAGDNSATGPIAVGVLTGDNSVLTNGGSGAAADTGGVAAVGVLTGDNSVKGQTAGDALGAPFLGIAALSGNNVGNDPNAGLNANVLTGSGASSLPTVPVVVTPGSNPDDNKETAQKDDQSELCKLLEKDNRGRVQGKLALKARCHIKTGA